MKIGSFRYDLYRFVVFDDGSLACGNTWYEDAITAARELQLPEDLLVREVKRCLEEWRGPVLLRITRTQGGDEHVIISAYRPVEYGVLDGNTIKLKS